MVNKCELIPSAVKELVLVGVGVHGVQQQRSTRPAKNRARRRSSTIPIIGPRHEDAPATKQWNLAR